MPAFAWSCVSAGPWHWPQLEASTFSADARASAAGSLFATDVSTTGVVAPALGQPASNGLSAQVSRFTGGTSTGAFRVLPSELLPSELPQASASTAVVMPKLSRLREVA